MTGGHWQFSASVRCRSSHLAAGAIKADTVSAAKGDTSLLSYGTGSGKVDLIVATSVALGPDGTVTWDLYASSFADLNNLSANFRSVKSLFVRIADGGDTSGVQFGGAGSNPWLGSFGDTSDKVTIFPDGPPFVMGKPAGIAVTATSRNLLVTNLGDEIVNLEVFIAGSRTGGGSGGEVFGLPGMTYP